MKNRKREICTSGSVRNEDGNILIYSARPPVYVAPPCAAGIRNPSHEQTCADTRSRFITARHMLRIGFRSLNPSYALADFTAPATRVSRIRRNPWYRRKRSL